MYYHLIIFALMLIKSFYKIDLTEKSHQIFVINGFYYPNSQLDSEGVAKTSNTIVLTMFNNKSAAYEHWNPICIVNILKDDDVNMDWIKKKGKLDSMKNFTFNRQEEGNEIGNLEMFRLVCSSVSAISSVKFRLNQKSSFFEAQIKRVDPTRRNLLFCPGTLPNILQADKFITVVEMLRHHQFDLLALHVRSVPTVFFMLLEAYVEEGLMELKNEQTLPITIDTKLNNILFNKYECLQEYRENTEFISFASWDEFPITDEWRPLASIMNMDAIKWLIDEKDPDEIVFDKQLAILENVNTQNVTDSIDLFVTNKQLSLFNSQTDCALLIRPKRAQFLQNFSNCDGLRLPKSQAYYAQFLEGPIIEDNGNASKTQINLDPLMPEFSQFLLTEPRAKAALIEWNNLANIYGANTQFEHFDDQHAELNRKCFKVISKWTTIKSRNTYITISKIKGIGKKPYTCAFSTQTK